MTPSHEPELPLCTCGSNRWRGCGGTVGAGSSQWYYECAQCNALATRIVAAGGNVLLIRHSEKVCQYVDRTLRAVWRVREEKLEAARSDHRAKLFAKVDALLGITDPDQPILDEDLDQRRYDERRKIEAEYPFQIPAELRMIPLPPKMFSQLSYWDLEHVITYVRQPVEIDGSFWQRVNYAETEDLPLPIDPIRVKHDAYFKAVFEAVEAATGVSFTREEIENEYDHRRSEKQPWYRCYAKGYLHAEFRIGPRKHVDSFEVTQSTNLPGWPILKLRKLALADNVTYEEDGRYYYQGFTGETAHHVQIHAWTQAKGIEYLTLLIEAIKEAAK